MMLLGGTYLLASLAAVILYGVDKAAARRGVRRIRESTLQLVALVRRLSEAGLALYEADTRPPERYPMERFITAPVTVTGTPDEEGATQCPPFFPRRSARWTWPSCGEKRSASCDTTG